MPLRDHFYSPLDDRMSWEGFYGGWPVVIVQHMNKCLPLRFAAAPSIYVETQLLDEYEVRVYDTKRGRRLVAAVEIVSPANKDRPENRRLFVAKCAALLQQRVTVAIVDLVTSRHFNLYADLLELLNQRDANLGDKPPSLYAVSCRWRPNGTKNILEAWNHTLSLDKPLPTLPLWLADDFAVPLELEASYEKTCRDLRIVDN